MRVLLQLFYRLEERGGGSGLIKKVDDDLEMHVRSYDGYILEPEIELSRECLEHPYE